MKKDSEKNIVRRIIFIIFTIFIGVSFFLNFTPGEVIAGNFASYALNMLKIVPFVFILIGLFDVWIDKKTIQKHLGKDGGMKSFFWVFILAAPMAGGLLPALPIGYELHRKGARYTVVLAFLGAVSIGRVPMILFESTFLGWKFSLVRLIVSIPLVLLTAGVIGRHFDKTGYKLPKDEE